MTLIPPASSLHYAALLQLNDEAQNARKGLGRFFSRQETIYRAAFLQTFAYATRDVYTKAEYFDFIQDISNAFATRNYDGVRELIEKNVTFTLSEDAHVKND